VQRPDPSEAADRKGEKFAAAVEVMLVRVRNDEAAQHEEEIHKNPAISEEGQEQQVTLGGKMIDDDDHRADAAPAIEYGESSLSFSHVIPLGVSWYSNRNSMPAEADATEAIDGDFRGLRRIL
jgi:hypothetical protein